MARWFSGLPVEPADDDAFDIVPELRAISPRPEHVGEPGDHPACAKPARRTGLGPEEVLEQLQSCTLHVVRTSHQLDRITATGSCWV